MCYYNCTTFQVSIVAFLLSAALLAVALLYRRQWSRNMVNYFLLAAGTFFLEAFACIGIGYELLNGTQEYEIPWSCATQDGNELATVAVMLTTILGTLFLPGSYSICMPLRDSIIIRIIRAYQVVLADTVNIIAPTVIIIMNLLVKLSSNYFIFMNSIPLGLLSVIYEVTVWAIHKIRPKPLKDDSKHAARKVYSYGYMAAQTSESSV
jgi:hypothetical protein